LLITFEGIDGSGKTTQISMLRDRLEASGVRSIVVREPGGTALSERVRSILLDTSLEMTPMAELLLFSAARTQLVTDKIVPALEAGDVVLCDRFFDSTIAYQGGGRLLGRYEWIREFSRTVTLGIVPDRTYLLRLPDEAAVSRRASRDSDRMESGSDGYFRRIAETYDRIAVEEPERILVLDGAQSPEYIHSRIWSDVLAMGVSVIGAPGTN
jgi:dTMP kinase